MTVLTIRVKYPNSAADPRLQANTYRINVRRAKSANADLKSLELNRRELAESVYVPLSFSPGVTNYNISVDPEVAGINVMATVADDRSVFRLGAESPPSGSEPGVLSIDRLVPLQFGLNRIYLEVTAQNGNKKTYTLYITRKKYQIEG